MVLFFGGLPFALFDSSKELLTRALFFFSKCVTRVALLFGPLAPSQWNERGSRLADSRLCLGGKQATFIGSLDQNTPFLWGPHTVQSSSKYIFLSIYIYFSFKKLNLRYIKGDI
jgi:hypothetical protein